MAQTDRMDVGGRVERRFEAVREVFGRVLAGQAGTGAAVAAWWDGAWVVDLWGGWADAAGSRRWGAGSLVQPYSVSKPFAAVCALVLADRGQLELGLDFLVGLTAAEQARAVELTGVAEYSQEQQAAGRPELYQRAVANLPGAFDPAVVNGSAWRAAEVPAVNGHGTARGAAGLYAALLRAELLSPALLAEATTAQCSGVDAVFGQHSAWGLGFGVSADGFGMGGSGGSYAGACTVGGYAFACMTGTMGSHARATMVENAFRGCLGMPPLDE